MVRLELFHSMDILAEGTEGREQILNLLPERVTI